MPVKIDLGIMFPGILSLIIGIFLIIVWIIITIVGMFIPLDYFVHLALLIIAVGCIIAGIIQIFRGLSGLREIATSRKYQIHSLFHKYMFLFIYLIDNANESAKHLIYSDFSTNKRDR